MRSEVTPTKEGSEAMITLRPNDAEKVDLMSPEHRVSLGWPSQGSCRGNVASADAARP